MLDGDDIVGRLEEGTDDSRRVQTLLDIEVRRRLVEHVAIERDVFRQRTLRGGMGRWKRDSHISVLHAGHTDREPLQLSSRQLADLALHNDIEIQRVDDLVEVRQLLLRIEHLPDSLFSFDRARDVIDVLRLDEGFNVVFEDLGEVVLELRSTEVLEDLLPVRRGLLLRIESAVYHRCSTREQQGARTSNFPRLGFNFPLRIFSAVDFPIPLVPTSPRTCPGLGVGRR